MSLVPLKVFSLQDPLNPSLVWQGPDDLFEVHDVFVRDNLAILNCGFEGIRVYDFSIPSQPIYKSNLSFYQDQGYNHQGWLCPDNETYIFADETAGTKVNLILDGRSKNQSSTSAVLRQVNPVMPIGQAVAGLLVEQKALGPRKTLIGVPLFDRGSVFGATNKTSLELSDNLTLKNIISFRRNRTDRGSDYRLRRHPVQHIPDRKHRSAARMVTGAGAVYRGIPDPGQGSVNRPDLPDGFLL